MAAFDPLAGSQINVDPSLGDSRYEALVRQLIARGMSPEEARKQARAMLESPDIVGQRPIAVEEAELNAAQDAAQPQINSYRAGYTQPAPGTAAWKAQERSMGLETLPFQQDDEQAVRDEFYRRFGREPSSYREVEMMRGMMAEQGAAQLRDDLAQGGYGQRRVPGPAGLDGRAQTGKPFASVEDAEAYNYRQPMDNGGFGDSWKDHDMRARGYAPVVRPDGRVSYMVASTEGGILPGAPGRPGYRADLVNTGKYEKSVAIAPSGDQVEVLAPTAQFRQKMAEQDKAIDGARAKRKATQDARMERFLAQLQLGGGRQTPQAIATERMLYEMSPEQRQQALRYMAPGGQLAAGVDAQNMQNANRIIERFMTSGAAGVMMNPVAQQRAEMEARQNDPAAAGASDVAGGKPDTPEAQAELNRLADSYDTTYGGFSYENERALAAALTKPPYNMSQADAEATAFRLAEKRRWMSGGKPAGPAAPATPPASPPAVVPPGSVPPV